MSRVVISDPLIHPASTLLRIIEQDPDSFTQGRRNNDIVNWFIICRIGEMTDGIELRPDRFYVDDFEDMMEDTLTHMQKAHLDAWSEDYRSKLRRLHAYYGHNSITQLRYIWRQVDYAVGPPIHDKQTELPV